MAGSEAAWQAAQMGVPVIIHEMLTGSLPWQGRYEKSAHRPLPPLQGHNAFVPLWINNVLQIALQHQPKQRFSDAAEFRDALRRPIRSRKPAVDNDVRQLRIWKGISIVLVVLLLISVAGGF